MITIPYPPSANRLWRNVGNQTLLSKEGRAYKKAVASLSIAGNWPKYGDQSLRVSITAYMPDKRRRDIDNLLKISLDSLTYAGIWDDDSQIDDLHIKRGAVEKPGRIEVEIFVI